ncbi:hypothetical protein NLX83_35685 [Allokutzneria sp. A3M-2-11 16]|uniref:hypothetical protein n=1 Tax=Allokutzneria sp. A3M-2-11 16 TaxID=2962043 RepID=UPI0020B7D29F|nr:hypothetical protein [Allokutzneria sp. A3M-2-11 16]MCP3804626.1 hypothetical protein [Allokutzneria sp. A3M-2-11 16]
MGMVRGASRSLVAAEVRVEGFEVEAASRALDWPRLPETACAKAFVLVMPERD